MGELTFFGDREAPLTLSPFVVSQEASNVIKPSATRGAGPPQGEGSHLFASPGTSKETKDSNKERVFSKDRADIAKVGPPHQGEHEVEPGRKSKESGPADASGTPVGAGPAGTSAVIAGTPGELAPEQLPESETPADEKNPRTLPESESHVASPQGPGVHRLHPGVPVTIHGPGGYDWAKQDAAAEELSGPWSYFSTLFEDFSQLLGLVFGCGVRSREWNRYRTYRIRRAAAGSHDRGITVCRCFKLRPLRESGWLS